jgi:hypothetical protein
MRLWLERSHAGRRAGGRGINKRTFLCIFITCYDIICFAGQEFIT